MFTTEIDFESQLEALEYAREKGLLVNLTDRRAINPENGKRYYLSQDRLGLYYWERV